MNQSVRDGDAAAESNTKAKATLSVLPLSLFCSHPVPSADAIVMRDLPAAVKVRVKSAITIKIKCAQIYSTHSSGWPMKQNVCGCRGDSSGGRKSARARAWAIEGHNFAIGPTRTTTTSWPLHDYYLAPHTHT
jgi:hypothetical protein